jgi:hypothetical protein
MTKRDYLFVQLAIITILVTLIACKAIILRPEWFGEAAEGAATGQQASPCSNNHQ